MITNVQPSKKIANSTWQKASISILKNLHVTLSRFDSFIQYDFIKNTENLLKHRGIGTEIPRVFLNPKRILRKFFQLQNEGEEIHNSEGTIRVEYSTRFSLSLIILQQIMHKGIPIRENTMHIIFPKFSKLKNLRSLSFDSNICFVYLRTQVYNFVAKNNLRIWRK